MRKILLPQINPQEVVQEIGDFVNQQVSSVQGSGGVIGLSGGVDSTTTAAIVKQAFDKSGYELVGYVLPSKINSQADTRDGISVAKRLGIRYEVIDIEPAINGYRATNPEAFSANYHQGNLISRVRATVLNTKGATENKSVIGTGNRDEDYGIGYYTLFGDGAVHMGPIADLSKRLVREVACSLGFKDLAYREPSAGLEPGQTDFKDLGYSYDLVERVTEGFDQGFSREELARHEQIAPLFEQEQQQYSGLYGQRKFSSSSEMLEDIARRHEIAKSKVQVVSPPVAQVTKRYV